MTELSRFFFFILRYANNILILPFCFVCSNESNINLLTAASKIPYVNKAIQVCGKKKAYHIKFSVTAETSSVRGRDLHTQISTDNRRKSLYFPLFVHLKLSIYSSIFNALSFTEVALWVWQVTLMPAAPLLQVLKHLLSIRQILSGKAFIFCIMLKHLLDVVTFSSVGTLQNNEQLIQKSCLTVSTITVHLLMKQHGSKCNKTLLRFTAAALCLIVPIGNSASYLLCCEM